MKTNLGLSELDPLAGGEPREIVFHVLKNQVKTTSHSWSDQAFELNHIGVVKAAQNKNLSGHEFHALWL